MNTIENARYREAAEYETTVEAARKAAGIVTSADCLAYELRQYIAAYSQQVYSLENRDEEGPELLSEEHPHYTQRLADRKEEGERQLSKIYALHGQELADEWAAARSNARDERILLACLLKESAHRLLAGYGNYLTQVGEGRVLPGSVGFLPRIGGNVQPVETFESRLRRMKERHENGRPGYGLSYGAGRYAELDRGLIAAGAGAAELAHFHKLLAAFHEREIGSSDTVLKPEFEYISIKTPIEMALETFSKKMAELEAKANADGYTFHPKPKAPKTPLSADSTAAAPVGVRAAKRSPGQLSVDELALLCVYAGYSITNEDAAKPYLEGNVKSGRALYNKFAYYSKRSNRIGFADATAKKRNNMITRIQKVLPRLTDEQKKSPEREIVILEGQN